MRSGILACWVAGLVGTLGCSSARTVGSPSVEPTRLMNGEFHSPCFLRDEQETRMQSISKSGQYSLRVTEGLRAELIEMSFSDDTCQTLEFIVTTDAAISDDQAAGDARSVQIQLSKLEATALTESAARILSEVKLHNHTDYRVGEGRALDLSKMPEEYSRAKGLYKLDGSKLELSLCESSPACDSLEGALPFTRMD